MHKISAIIITLFALAAISCSEVEDVIFGGEDGRTPITFSLSDEAVRSTRGGFAGDHTFLAMRIQSISKKAGADPLYTRTTATAEKDATNDDDSYSAVTFQGDQVRYWDDAHGQYSVLSVYAVAIPNMATDVNGLATKLAAGSSGSTKWGNVATNTIKWSVSTTSQTKDDVPDNTAAVTSASGTIDQEDLVYSNNIQAGGTDGVYRWNFGKRVYEPEATGTVGVHKAGPMMFIWESFDPDEPLTTPSAPVGKFDKGHLVFRHALSRITVTLKKGNGFEGAESFRFDNGTTIKLCGMKTGGILDLPSGTWSSVATGDINKMGRTDASAATSATGTFMGQMLPDYSFANGAETVVMEFSIDGNTYYVTQDMLYDALYANDVNRKPSYGYDSYTGKFTMMQGKNYKFIFTVNKRKVEVITASLVDWEDVNANEKDLTNARIKLRLEERGTAQTDVAFYKADDNYGGLDINDGYTTYNWTAGYTNLGATYNLTAGYWTSSKFWETSRDFYHFRALLPASTEVTPDGSGDYFSITSASCSNAESYAKIAWGAPMLDDKDDEAPGDFKWEYDFAVNGFDGPTPTTQHQIYPAIGPTLDPVKLTLFHLMSGVHFTIKTTDDAARVQLYNPTGTKRTKLELVGYYPTGKVLLGTGLITPNGTLSTIASPQDVACATTSTGEHDNQEYFFSAVPQDLTAVKLYITTPDGNRYILDLKDAKATTITTNNLANPYTLGSDGKYTLGRWYPGFKYNYSFTLRKTGITHLQATVVDWESVTADDETVTIK